MVKRSSSVQQHPSESGGDGGRWHGFPTVHAENGWHCGKHWQQLNGPGEASSITSSLTDLPPMLECGTVGFALETVQQMPLMLRTRHAVTLRTFQTGGSTFGGTLAPSQATPT
jgi:hypothetical protein